MNPIFDGCRLCLDSFAESFTTINNPQLKNQMEKVFCFSIEPKQGYCSGVCENCSYAISEFYQYSEKVRQNQELLNGNVTNCDPTVKITIESVKVETLDDSELPETTEDACAPKNEVSGEEEVPNFGDDDLYESPPKKSQRRPGKRKLNDLEADEPSSQNHEVLNRNVTICDQTKDLKNTLESVQVETLSDSGIAETTGDACEPNVEASGEEKVLSKHDDLNADEPAKTSQRTMMQIRNEEDELFNKRFRMICDLCGTSATTFTALGRHFWEEHKRRTAYVVCCNKKLYNRQHLRNHIDFHANPDAFQCKVCGNKYMTKETLKRHIRYKHSSDDQGPLQCDHCPQSFSQEFALVEHMKQHVRVKCPECDKMLHKDSLSRHMTTQHSGKNQTMVCDTCGKKFRDKKWFTQHMNEHMGIEVQRVQCGICQRWFKSAANLRNHMNTIHSDHDREFQCNICLQKYPHPHSLRHHKRIHAEPKHECEFCGKKFIKRIALKEHRIIHTGEVLYTCEYCGIPKNKRWRLYHHIKRQHPTEWAQKKLKATQKNRAS